MVYVYMYQRSESLTSSLVSTGYVLIEKKNIKIINNLLSVRVVSGQCTVRYDVYINFYHSNTLYLSSQFMFYLNRLRVNP